MSGTPIAKTILAAAALVAVSLSAPQAADMSTPSGPGAQTADVAVPLPKPRPSYVHRRTARVVHWRRAVVRQETDWPRQTSWFFRRYERPERSGPACGHNGAEHDGEHRAEALLACVERERHRDGDAEDEVEPLPAPSPATRPEESIRSPPAAPRCPCWSSWPAR